MYPLHPVSAHPLNSEVKVSLNRGQKKLKLKPQEEAFFSRNCFMASQNPKRAHLKSYQRINKQNGQRIRSKDGELSSARHSITHEGTSIGKIII